MAADGVPDADRSISTACGHSAPVGGEINAGHDGALPSQMSLEFNERLSIGVVAQAPKRHRAVQLTQNEIAAAGLKHSTIRWLICLDHGRWQPVPPAPNQNV